MRGVVFKTHQDPTSAAVAYLVRKHAVPGFEMFGRMALNFSTGGINVAAVEHFSQIKGGWGRIIEMPTRDSCGNGPPNMDAQYLAQNRPWMLLMPPGSPQCVATVKNGELVPEVKYLIGVLAKIAVCSSGLRSKKLATCLLGTIRVWPGLIGKPSVRATAASPSTKNVLLLNPFAEWAAIRSQTEASMPRWRPARNRPARSR